MPYVPADMSKARMTSLIPTRTISALPTSDESAIFSKTRRMVMADAKALTHSGLVLPKASGVAYAPNAFATNAMVTATVIR